MEIADLLPGPDAVLACVKASGKKALLAELAAKAAHLYKLDERRLFDRLLERERLGSTGIGGGIAIPHGRMAGLAKPVGVFARLGHPVDFDSIDERPVDSVFLLLAPRAPAPTISRRWPASRACCATAPWSRSCAPPRAPTRSTPCSSRRCRRRARLRSSALPA